MVLGDSPTPKQPDEAGDCPVGDAQESGGRASWEILPFGGDREEALRFGGGAQGDTGVSTEQSGGLSEVICTGTRNSAGMWDPAMTDRIWIFIAT